MNKQQLASRIWESANKMRSKIEANEYKDYILGFIFYKYLSRQRSDGSGKTISPMRISGNLRKKIRKRWNIFRIISDISSHTIICIPRGWKREETSTYRT